MKLDVFLYRLESTFFYIYSESGEFLGFGDTSNSDYVQKFYIYQNCDVLSFRPILAYSLKIIIEKR